MPADASQDDAVPSEGTASGGPLTRRWFLTYVVAAPVLTVAAGSARALIAPDKAYAVVPSPLQPGDLVDLGDVMVAAAKQAQHLFVLEVTPENRVVFQVPRAEVGQGITTALPTAPPPEEEPPTTSCRPSCAGLPSRSSSRGCCRRSLPPDPVRRPRSRASEL
jgi:isoquinoline 1-oxidoreductase beta subunit